MEEKTQIENPPAFSSSASQGDHWELGMSLRDYFAAKIMQGMIVNPEIHAGEYAWDEHNSTRAYEIADAMLKARMKPIE